MHWTYRNWSLQTRVQNAHVGEVATFNGRPRAILHSALGTSIVSFQSFHMHAFRLENTLPSKEHDPPRRRRALSGGE